MSSFSELYKSFSPDVGLRGKQFEVFTKWLLESDPVWSAQIECVWLWNDYPDRWGPDCGIDLVAQSKTGELWAVQAKCYSPEYDITKGDVDRFLSESNRKSIARRILVASTDRFSQNAKQVCECQEKPVSFYTLSDLESANVDYPDNILSLKTVARKAPPTPREHQVRAISAVKLGFQRNQRGQLIMACGTGKTYTTLWIKEAIGAQRVLVLVPSLNLLAQTLKEWVYAATQKFTVLCICSDQSVGKNESDDNVVSNSDLAYPVCSNPDAIAVFLKENAASVVFCTYQSSWLIAQIQEDPAIPEFDLAIADEAHRCAGKTASEYNLILNKNAVRVKKLLFATATPRTYSHSLKQDSRELGVEVVGMDDEEVFGPIFHELKFSEAIKIKELTDYRLVIVGVNDPSIKKWIDERKILDFDGKGVVDARLLGSMVGLSKAICDYDLKRVISFHSRVSKAEMFSNAFNRIFNNNITNSCEIKKIWADYVCGEMPTATRRNKLNRLKVGTVDSSGLLCNSKCLSEDIDVPSLDGVAFIDPRSSQVDIIQAVGRAIRKSQNKKYGTIIIPVFVGDQEDGISAIESSRYVAIWDVINALKSHDSDLANELDCLRTQLGRNDVGRVPVDSLSKIIIDIPIFVGQEFLEHFKTRLVQETTSTWHEWYGLLLRWRDINIGQSIPGVLDVIEDKKIGVWVATQRACYKKGLLTKEKVESLQSLDGWSWSPIDELWKQGYSALEVFYEENESTRVPSGYVTSSGLKLGMWVKTRRLDYSRNILTPEKVASLEKFSDWSWDPNQDDWANNYRDLCAVLKTFTLKEVEAARNNQNSEKLNSIKHLSAWISAQRRNYLYWKQNENGGENRYPRITPRQIEMLEGIVGWSWNRREDRWRVSYKVLKDYLSERSFQSITPATMHQGVNIGKWLVKQRGLIKNGKLPQIKLRLLEEIGWVQSPFDEQWNSAYSSLVKYCQLNGTGYVPQKTVFEGARLGSWVSTQRIAYKSGKLASEKVQRLEKLAGWQWNAVDKAAHLLSKIKTSK